MNTLPKCPTGIPGLDAITDGGLPRGRPTLICGGAGSGKTLLAMEFVVRGARDFGEPGLFVAFEEDERELAANVASLGFDLPALAAQKKLLVDHVHVERSEIEETGEYDLEGLFVRLGSAIDTVGAKRLALDSLEALFAAFPNEAIVRAELRRLFTWLKQRGVSAAITAEQGHGTLTRHGLEEYVSDCVIFLDHRVANQVATRRLRIVKYRGSLHGTNEYPTMIDRNGLSVLPISSIGLDYPVSKERVSTGIAALDAMFEGGGYYKGSSVLISGTAGTGKTSFAASFADAACRRGERCLYLSFEESAAQIVRNMGSIGFDLARWEKQDRLHFRTVRSTLFGLEQHLVAIHKLVEEFAPDCFVMDPITNLSPVGSSSEVAAMLMRIIDFLKQLGVTAVFTSLDKEGEPVHLGDAGISSLMDTWLQLGEVRTGPERTRVFNIRKSRGMGHSSVVREFALAGAGIQIPPEKRR